MTVANLFVLSSSYFSVLREGEKKWKTSRQRWLLLNFHKLPQFPPFEHHSRTREMFQTPPPMPFNGTPSNLNVSRITGRNLYLRFFFFHFCHFIVALFTFFPFPAVWNISCCKKGGLENCDLGEIMRGTDDHCITNLCV